MSWSNLRLQGNTKFSICFLITYYYSSNFFNIITANLIWQIFMTRFYSFTGLAYWIKKSVLWFGTSLFQHRVTYLTWIRCKNWFLVYKSNNVGKWHDSIIHPVLLKVFTNASKLSEKELLVKATSTCLARWLDTLDNKK